MHDIQLIITFFGWILKTSWRNGQRTEIIVQSLPTDYSKTKNISCLPVHRCWRLYLMTCHPLYLKYTRVSSHNLLHRSRMSTTVSSTIILKDNSHFPSCSHLNLITTGVINFKTLLVLLLWAIQDIRYCFAVKNYRSNLFKLTIYN